MKANKLYINQYGDKFYAMTLKELREQIPGACEKMYLTLEDVNYHVGYVIGKQ